MTKTVKTIVNDFIQILALPAISSLFSGSNQQKQAAQIKRLLNDTAVDLRNKSMPLGGFRELEKDYTFNTVANVESYDLPTDFNFFISETAWDITNKRPMVGALDNSQWQFLKYSRNDYNMIDRCYRLRGNSIDIYPIPKNDGEILTLKYISKHLFINNNKTQTFLEPTSDSDIFLLDENLLYRGMLYHWKALQGLPNDIEAQAYNNIIKDVIGNNNTPMTIHLNHNRYHQYGGLFNQIVG